MDSIFQCLKKLDIFKGGEDDQKENLDKAGIFKFSVELCH